MSASLQVNSMPQTVTVHLPHREKITLQVDAQGNVQWQVMATESTWQLLRQFKSRYGSVFDWPEPQGHSVSELLLKVLLRKLRGQWDPPYGEDELCHCRMVPTERVVEAVICGAHSTDQVSRWTQASTACGTCRPDSLAMIDYILNLKQS